jgi:hypothetical protein
MRLKVRLSGQDRRTVHFSDLPLAFEGNRVFVIWDCAKLGNCELQARIELDPKLLRKSKGRNSEYVYQGHLVLPRPQDN